MNAPTKNPNENVVMLTDVRLSFPNLIEPQIRTNEQTGKQTISYNCDLIMPPNHPGFAAFFQTYTKLAVEEWKEHAQTLMGMIHNERKRRCYTYGAERVNQQTLLPYDGYVGMVAISCGRKNPPQFIDENGVPADPQNTMAAQAIARRLYGGCRVNVAIKPWLQNNEHGRAVRCDLVAIQFLRDDAAFGEGPVDTTGMFGAVAGAPVGVPAAGGMPLPGQMPGRPQSAPAMPQMPGMPFPQAQPGFQQPGMPPMPGAAPQPQMPNLAQPGMPSFLS